MPKNLRPHGQNWMRKDQVKLKFEQLLREKSAKKKRGVTPSPYLP